MYSFVDVIRPLRGICGKKGLTKFLTILPNCSAGVTVTVDNYVKNSIYNFDFYNFLWFTLDLHILGSLKCLMTSGSIKSIKATNLCFYGSFLMLLFHVFVKHKRDLRLKYVLVALVFVSSNFYLSTNDNLVYNNVKLCNRLQFYSPDYISTCNELHDTVCCLNFLFSQSLNLNVL